jgi:AcrR family transcriptional regulator
MSAKPTRQSAIEKNERRRLEIIQIAIPFFASEPPEGVSLRDIAKAAGMRAGTLHYYFPEKLLLYQAAVDYALTRSSETLIGAMLQGSAPAQRLDNIIDVYFRVFGTGNPIGILADRELLKIVQNPRAAQLTPVTIASFRQNQDLLQALISEISGIDKVSPDAIRLAEFATSSIYGAARLHPWHQQTQSVRESVDELEKLKADLRDGLIAMFRGFRTGDIAALPLSDQEKNPTGKRARRR